MESWDGACCARCIIMASIERTRERWLDGLKGFGCLLVILGHVLSGYLDAWTFPDFYWEFYGLRTWIYSFHMPLFFMLSGFTFTLAYFQAGHLRRERFFRQLVNLIWIYVIFSLLLWGVKQVVPELVNETYTLEDLVKIFWEPLGNFWYIYVLCLLYIIAAVTGLPNRSPIWLLPLGAISVYVAQIHLDWTNLTLYRLCYHLFFFALGGVFCRHRRLLKSQKLLGLSAMLLATAAYFYFIWYTRDWYAVWKVLIAVATCCVFFWEFSRWKRLSGFGLFQLFGKYALEVYLLHVFLTGGLRTLLPMLGVTAAWPSVWLNFLLSAGVSLMLAVFLGRFRGSDLLFRPTRLLRKSMQK